jgi:hypothetical protein
MVHHPSEPWLYIALQRTGTIVRVTTMLPNGMTLVEPATERHFIDGSMPFVHEIERIAEPPSLMVISNTDVLQEDDAVDDERKDEISETSSTTVDDNGIPLPPPGDPFDSWLPQPMISLSSDSSVPSSSSTSSTSSHLLLSVKEQRRRTYQKKKDSSRAWITSGMSFSRCGQYLYIMEQSTASLYQLTIDTGIDHTHNTHHREREGERSRRYDW